MPSFRLYLPQRGRPYRRCGRLAPEKTKDVSGDDHGHDSQHVGRGTRRSQASSRLAATLKRWWLAYLTWRIEQEAITQLCSMSDRALKDIGLTRADITGAVRGEVPRDRAFRRY